MKKILIALLIIAIYLNRSYAYFYDFLNQHHLFAPISKTTMIIGNQPNLPTIKYLALGDSLTAGVGVADYKNSFPYLVALKLSSKQNIELINLARPGDTSSDLLINQIPKTLAEKPDLITILIGVNDIHNFISLKKFEDNLTQIVKALKQTNAKIYLLSLPYLGSDRTILPPYNLILDQRTKQFNGVIKKLSIDFKVNYINLYAIYKPADFYSDDLFHPAAAGYSLWATYIESLLQ